MSRTKKAAEVPVLDKGNYNNQRNLLYFMEQEAIAAKMIEEARSFYNNFLISKTTKLKDILKYPNVSFIRPVIHAYIKKAWGVKEGCAQYNKYATSPEDNLAVTVSFCIDFGEEGTGSKVWEYFSRIIDNYTRRGAWSNPDDDYYNQFKNKDLIQDLKLKWQAFEKKLDNYDYKAAEDGKTYSIGAHYLCDINIQELINLKIHNPKDPFYTNWTESGYGKNKNLFAYRYTGHGYRQQTYQRVGLNSRFTEFDENYVTSLSDWNCDECPLLIEHPKVKKYVDEKIKELMPEFKALFISMMDNIKSDKDNNGKSIRPYYIRNLLDTNFLFERDGSIVELITNEIESTKFDKKKGLYIITCKHKVEEHAKWQFPSNGPRIRTEYYQVFTFDVATNDLLSHEYHYDSDEIQYR